VPTDNIERQRDVQHAATLNLGLADELLVGLFAALHNGPAWTLDLLTNLRPSQRERIAGRPASALAPALAKLRELELVDERGELDVVARALLELVSLGRKDAPYSTSSRNCFGVEWYTDELGAEVRGFEVRNHHVNGGFLHGQKCGRAPSFDHYAGAARLFAVVVP
jgi:hypothetical protein